MVEDAASMWRLAVGSRRLDANSPYAYLLICSHFAPTSLVAASGEDGIVGFVASYRLPEDPGVLFVWQVAVSPDHRRRGIGLRMLRHLLQQPAVQDVRQVHATVTPSNGASDRLFRSLAATVGAACATAEHYSADLFPDVGHEAEVLYQVGPIPTRSEPTQ